MIDMSANLPSDTPIEPVGNKAKGRREQYKKQKPRSKLIELADDQRKNYNGRRKSSGKAELQSSGDHAVDVRSKSSHIDGADPEDREEVESE